MALSLLVPRSVLYRESRITLVALSTAAGAGEGLELGVLILSMWFVTWLQWELVHELSCDRNAHLIIAATHVSYPFSRLSMV